MFSPPDAYLNLFYYNICNNIHNPKFSEILFMKKLLSFLLFYSSLSAYENTRTGTTYNEVPWGAGAVLRNTSSLFTSPVFSGSEEDVSNFILLLYYQGEHLYMDGTEFGYRADITEEWSISAFARLRFTNLPEEKQNQYQLDSYDPGLQLRYTFHEGTYAEIELMTDIHNSFYANLAYQHTYSTENIDFIPYGMLSYKSSSYNTRYYGLKDLDGLQTEKLDAGMNVTAGIDLWYHLYSDFYLYGRAQVEFLSPSASKSPYIAENQLYEYWLGMALRNDKNRPLQTDLQSKPYLRAAYGFATTANLGEIIIGETVPDKFNNRMVSLFYGHPLSDTLFNLPVSVYFTPGIAWHQTSDVQDNIAEFILAMKAFYTIPLPWHVRLGVATGLSYVTDTTYIEDIDMDPGKQSSKLLQHLGFSIDLSLEDILGTTLEGLWIGYDIHHRSAVFEHASQYGHFKGGSNYNSIYLQYHY